MSKPASIFSKIKKMSVGLSNSLLVTGTSGYSRCSWSSRAVHRNQFPRVFGNACFVSGLHFFFNLFLDLELRFFFSGI